MLALTKNPLWLREWRASSRLARTPWLLGGLGLAMAAVLVLQAVDGRHRVLSTLGNDVFQLYFSLSSLFVIFFGPAIAANAIAIERESKTWEALLMSGLSPRKIDHGKFLGAYTHLCLYLFALLPAGAIPHLFGGVTLSQTLLGFGMLFGLGALGVRVGLLMSATLPSTRIALLATVAAAAMLCVGTAGLAFSSRSFLSDEAHFAESLGGPVWWPVALVDEPFGFEYLRYLVVIPIGAAVVAWYGLRELTVAALTPEAQPAVATRQRAFMILAPCIILLLAVVPHASCREIFGAQAMFAIFMFVSIVVLGGDRGHGEIGRLVLLALGVGGTFLIPVISGLLMWLGLQTTDEFARESVVAMLSYGPSFMLFLLGAIAWLGARLRNAVVARGAFVGVAFVATFAPLLIRGSLRFFEAWQASLWSTAFSPLSVVDPAPLMNGPLRLANGFWIMLGIGLLIAARRRAGAPRSSCAQARRA